MAKGTKKPVSDHGADKSKIGYGRPPAEHQFKPGVSGNPKGRAPGSRSFIADLEEELRERVQVSENGKKTLVTKQRLLTKSMVNKGIKGDTRAAKLTIDQIARHTPGQQDASDPAPLSETDDAILRGFVERLGRDYGLPDDD